MYKKKTGTLDKVEQKMFLTIGCFRMVWPQCQVQKCLHLTTQLKLSFTPFQLCENHSITHFKWILNGTNLKPLIWILYEKHNRSKDH